MSYLVVFSPATPTFSTYYAEHNTPFLFAFLCFMKKILFSFYTFIIFTNVSYASFPFSDTLKVQQDTLQTEEIKQYHYSLQQMGVDLKTCKCESCRNGIDPLLSRPKSFSVEVVENTESLNSRNSNPIWGFLSLTFMLISFILIGNVDLMLISTCLGLIFGAIGIKKKQKGLAFFGSVLSLLLLLFLSFIIIVIAVEGPVI